MYYWISGFPVAVPATGNIKITSRYIKNIITRDLKSFQSGIDKNSNRWLKASQQDSIIWFNTCDVKGPSGEISAMFKIYYIPKNYLIDPEGIIVAKDIRGYDLTEKLKVIKKNGDE